MRILALDTCDARGSIAVLLDGVVLGQTSHASREEYSSWLLPAVDEILASVQLTHADLDGYAVASGPGSFTGVRVGVTTVKAWSEVLGQPIAAVSRLEALASASSSAEGFIAPFFDAQRGQVFGGLYRRVGGSLELIHEEMVAPPDAFLNWVSVQADGERVGWISLDPHVLTSDEGWLRRSEAGETVESAPTELAPHIGYVGLRRLLNHQASDALRLDANYVRRSDAELFWKKSAGS